MQRRTPAGGGRGARAGAPGGRQDARPVVEPNGHRGDALLRGQQTVVFRIRSICVDFYYELKQLKSVTEAYN